MSLLAMASQGPKARYYPGANSLAIFSAQGSNPLQDCKVYGKGVTKVYDRSVKGYVYSITGGLQSKLQLPKDDSKIGLQLLQPFLVLQVFVPQGVHFSFELRVSDISNTRRKMYFSTSFNDIKSTHLHCQIPIFMVIQNKWLTLAFDILDLFNSCFRSSGGGGNGMNFRSIDMIVLTPVCKLRKIFTMRCRIKETNPKGYLEDSSEEKIENSLPHEHTYALGVDTCNQILDTTSIQSAMVCNNEAHQGRGPELGTGAWKWGAKQQQQAGKELGIIKKAVHVAFGTRMPLPLSTIHINTNLPHDKCPTIIKDNIGKVYFTTDSATAVGAITGGGGGGEVNIKPSSNMVSHALASLDLERRNLVNYGDSKLMLKTNRIGCSAQRCIEVEDHVTNIAQMATTDGSVACCSDGDGEPLVGASKEGGQTPKPIDQGSRSPKVGTQPQQQVGSINVGGVSESSNATNSSTIHTTSNKSPSKWGSRRKDVQLSTTNFKQQKCKQQRSKEYKQSRYMGSPPGSPPSGWDEISSGGRTLFDDNFLDGSWMNTQLSESIDAEFEKKSQHGDEEDSLKFEIHEDHFFEGHISGKRKDETGLETHSMADSYFPSIQGKGVEESLGFDVEPDTHEELELSFQEATHGVKTSGGFRRTGMDTIKTIMNSDTELATWNVLDTDKQPSCHISSGTTQHLVDLEHKAPIKMNGRPDEDLDLLYDPTLDCYYDPKTNRYYELK